ncbi:hypothetical protein BH10BDE1_BH10BDE1_24420 [soil metagenome]
MGWFPTTMLYNAPSSFGALGEIHLPLVSVTL